MRDDSKKAFSTSALLAAIVESSSDAIISKDLDGTILSWNRGATEIFGYTADETIGRSVTMLMPPDKVNEEPGILARIRSGERIDHYETVRQHKDGRLLDISLTVSPIYDAAGNIVGASKIARDITYRKAVEVEIARYAAIVDTASDAIISKDLNGIIRSWNRGATEIFGYEPDEMIGRSVTLLMPPDRINEEPGILARIRAGERVDHYETIRRHKDGRLLNISLNVSPIIDAHGVVIGASKIARDITIQRRTEAAIRESEIMHRLVDAQEGERQRIARDLHDHMGQRMTAMRLRLENLVRMTSDDPIISSEVNEIRVAATNIDREIGFLSWELRPTELDELGLENALGSFLREWSANYDIEAEFHVDKKEVGSLPVRLTPTIETNLYRIVQEGLNNTLKHANATSVSLLLHHRREELVIVIEDNGRGFDLTALDTDRARPSGLGLTGMQERAALLHGTLEIESAPGSGTTVIVRVPVGHD